MRFRALDRRASAATVVFLVTIGVLGTALFGASWLGTPSPSSSPEIARRSPEPPLADFGWFSLTESYVDPSTLAWLGGGAIALTSCAEAACEVRTIERAGSPSNVIAFGLPDRDVFGVARGQLIMGGDCEPACPAAAISLATGAVTSSVTNCGSVVVVDDATGPILLSDVTVDGRCSATGYDVRAEALAAGRIWQAYRSAAGQPTLVPRPGWELPLGWFLLGTDGQIGDGERSAVRLNDGRVERLPVESSPGPPIP